MEDPESTRAELPARHKKPWPRAENFRGRKNFELRGKKFSILKWLSYAALGYRDLSQEKGLLTE